MKKISEGIFSGTHIYYRFIFAKSPLAMNQALKTKKKPVLQKIAHLNLTTFNEKTLLGAIHRRRRNILGVSGGSEIPMLQEIER